MNRVKHYWLWFRKLQKQYNALTALMYFLYNAKHYNLDGSYR